MARELKYEVLTDELIEQIASSEEEQKRWLVLGDHPDFIGFWIVDCLNPDFFYDFEDIVGPYRAIDVGGLSHFASIAEQLGYSIAFESDPGVRIRETDKLSRPPEFSLSTQREGTINGFYPWQIQGFNYLKDQSGKAIWSTGTGKTVLAGMLLQHHLPRIDIAFYMSKVHNRTRTQRKLRNLLGIDSIVLDAWSAQKRADMYADLFRRLEDGEHIVAITNYEKFREDEEALKILLTDRDTLFIWDEMPTRLSNRGTLLYESVTRTIWRTEKDTPKSVPNPLVSRYRVKSYLGYELTAAPMENDPEGDFNCTRLIRPECFGSVAKFHGDHVRTYDYFDEHKPKTWKHLDAMALKQAHFTHVVNKKDPDIAKFFPKVSYEPYIVDWDQSHRKIYDKLTGKAREMLEGLEDANILALISTMQMMCDAPSMINQSAENRKVYESELESYLQGETDDEPNSRGSSIALSLIESLGPLSDERHGKLAALKDLVTNTHRDEHVLLYTVFGPMLLPTLSGYLTDWGVSHVVYTGTNKQKEDAYNLYRKGDHQLWLSSDAGADSIDLELASVGIDFDLPWKYVTRLQRWNRANRVGADHESQRFYSLIMDNSIEDRKLEIIAKKQGYYEAVYEGRLNDVAVASHTTREDLIYILTGE